MCEGSTAAQINTVMELAYAVLGRELKQLRRQSEVVKEWIANALETPLPLADTWDRGFTDAAHSLDEKLKRLPCECGRACS